MKRQKLVPIWTKLQFQKSSYISWKEEKSLMIAQKMKNDHTKFHLANVPTLKGINFREGGSFPFL